MTSVINLGKGTESWHPNQNTSLTSDAVLTTHKPNVADAVFEKDLRIIILYLETVFGIFGGILVLVWLWYNRRRKSRVNALILNVVLSDLMVMFGACMSQLIWEHSDRNWRAGVALCKLTKLIQTFSMTASNYMIVLLSVDRHQAIRSPLREPFKVCYGAALFWGLSLLLSSPQLFIFSVNNVKSEGIFQNKTVCESFWRSKPIAHRQAYMSFVYATVFFLPFIIISICYIRIFMKVAEKANETTRGMNGQSNNQKPGKIHLQSTGNTTLPKAKIKTLKMTVVIVATFILFGMPYYILEMIYSFGDHTIVPSAVASVLGGMAVANSASNPYVFLVFNVNVRCLRDFCAKALPCSQSHNQRRADAGFLETSTMLTARTEYTMHSPAANASSGRGLRYHMVGRNNEKPIEMTVKDSKCCTGKGSSGSGNSGGSTNAKSNYKRLDVHERVVEC